MTRILRKELASESNFRHEAPRFRYLHLATHGFFAPPQLQSRARPEPGRRPVHEPMGADVVFGSTGIAGFHPGLLSGVALAGANREPDPDRDDGILTSLEVSTLDLGRTDLVVLSACETGLGQIAGGEGLLGLQRAFQVSGARSVVASLWKVDDEATRLLMERFYENLWRKKLSKLEALRQAQLWMLNEGTEHLNSWRERGLKMVQSDEEVAEDEPRRLPPAYWAAFVLSGGWRE